jgi:hypothetical protein
MVRAAQALTVYFRFCKSNLCASNTPAPYPPHQPPPPCTLQYSKRPKYSIKSILRYYLLQRIVPSAQVAGTRQVVPDLQTSKYHHSEKYFSLKLQHDSKLNGVEKHQFNGGVCVCDNTPCPPSHPPPLTLDTTPYNIQHTTHNTQHTARITQHTTHNTQH